MQTQEPLYEELEISAANARLAILQLSVMMNSGISISRALESMTQARQSQVADLAEGIFRGIARGMRLSQAISATTGFFTEAHISSVQSGEKTGRLPFVLQRLSDNLDKDLRLRQQLKSALTYPVGILIVTALMALFMTNYMLPQLLSAAGTALKDPPWPTRVLSAISEHGGLLTFFFLIMVCSIPWFFSSVPLATQIRNWVLFRSPVVGTVGRNSDLARLSGQLALLLHAGLNLDRALLALRPRDPELRQAIPKVLKGVMRGLSLAEAFSSTGKFSREFVAFVDVGEETGRLGRALDHQSAILEESSRMAVDDAVQFIEPLAMLFLGGLVGFVILGCFLPIYQVVFQGL